MAEADPECRISEDVDGDSAVGLFFHFKTEELNLTKANTTATVTGQTADSHGIMGVDSVQNVPSDGKK